MRENAKFKGHVHHDVVGRLYEDSECNIYMGVTTILSPLEHSALGKWKMNFGVDSIKKRVRTALELLESGKKEEPVSILIDILGNDNPADIRKREAAEDGKTAHHIMECDLKGEKYDIPPGFEKFHADWDKFKMDHKLKPSALEEPFFSKRFGFAGRVDYLGYVESCNDPKCCRAPFSGTCVMDYKTGRWNSKIPFQLAAYKYGIEETHLELVNHTIALMINGKSAPKPLVMDHDNIMFPRFLATLDAVKGLYYKELKELNWPYLEKFALMEWWGVQEE
jgi:hypothetical protein